MNKFLFALVLSVLVLIDSKSYAQDTTFYLIRHAERAEDGTDDPDISDLGKQRARAFAELLQDINVTHIFSSPYKRTMNTAEPTARDHGLPIEEYDPRDLPALVEKIKKLEGTVVVFGHSNTTPVVANLLAGSNLENLDERIYDRVYIVSTNSAGETELRIEYTEPRTPI